MANYVPKSWADEVPNTTPLRFKITLSNGTVLAADATIELVTAITAGTPVNASNLNHMEQGIKAAQDGVNAGAPAIFQAKGDLIAGSGAGAGGRLAAGSNGQTLVADSSQALGVKWGEINAVKLCVTTKSTVQLFVGAATWYNLIWDGADLIDDWNGHDPATNNDRITIAEAGWYQVSAYIKLEAYENSIQFQLLKNGVAINQFIYYVNGLASQGDFVAPPALLAAGDYLQLQYKSPNNRTAQVETYMAVVKLKGA